MMVKKIGAVCFVIFLSCAGEKSGVKIIGMGMDEPVKGKTMRVFAIGHKQTIETAESEKEFF
jgi:hypothetical protein